MNSQIEILRETLEGMAKYGSAEFHLVGVSDSRVNPAYRGTAKEVAEDLLEMFPEEDSEHVKAFRAAEYLIDYLDDNPVEEPEYGIEKTLEHRLFDLRTKAEKPAVEDIRDRLEVDSEEMKFGGGMDRTTIHDPVSKLTTQVTDTDFSTGNFLENRTRYAAHDVLKMGEVEL